MAGFAPVTDPAILARLPEAARPHVVQVNLKALGITDYGEMRSRGFGRALTPAHCELFYGGHPMTLARWPNEGEWERIAGYPDAGATKDEHGGNTGKLEEGFHLHRRPPTPVEGPERPLGPRLLVLGLGQLL